MLRVAGRRMASLSRRPSAASSSSLLSKNPINAGLPSVDARSVLASTIPIALGSSLVGLHQVSGRRLSSIQTLRCPFSTSTSQFPHITDHDIKSAFKDLMAMSWDEIPDSVVTATKKALSKTTDDKVGQEALKNVFRAAEASVEFGAVLVSLRMALDDLSGLTGENVGKTPDYIQDAMEAAYKRYTTYLDSFGPDEAYLRKKVESELGTKMIHLKMRCSGMGSEWGKVTLLGTSGISGSYVEQRA